MAVDLSASIYSQYLRACKTGAEAEKHGKNQEAAWAYRQAADFMRSYAEYAQDRGVKKQRLGKAEGLQQAAKVLSDTPEGQRPRSLDKVSNSAKPARGESHEAESELGELEAQVRQLITSSQVTWENVAGMEETKAAIQGAYFSALAKKPPRVEINGARGILLYGPPGTGKTLLAAATAGSLDATFFNAKASDMLSKWFGESPQKVSALFRVAREEHPAVIFLDEIEALSISREASSNSANLQVVSTLLAELDGMGFKDESQFVLTIGATNVPWLLDSGILRRFPKRIYVPLPDLPLREAILCLHLQGKGHKSELPLTELAERTIGYSGDEIRQLCNTAVDAMIRRMNPDSLEVVRRGREAVQATTIRVDRIGEDEFALAFDLVKPITNPEIVQRYEKWGQTTKD